MRRIRQKITEKRWQLYPFPLLAVGLASLISLVALGSAAEWDDSQVLPVPLRSGLLADYSADAHGTLLPPPRPDMIWDTLPDTDPEEVLAVLQAPVPQVGNGAEQPTTSPIRTAPLPTIPARAGLTPSATAATSTPVPLADPSGPPAAGTTTRPPVLLTQVPETPTAISDGYPTPTPLPANQPDLPGKPEEPGNPEPPGKPEEPGNPEPPGKPEEPGNPEPPGKPEEPGNPEPPGKPEEPGNPEPPKPEPTRRPEPPKPEPTRQLEPPKPEPTRQLEPPKPEPTRQPEPPKPEPTRQPEPPKPEPTATPAPPPPEPTATPAPPPPEPTATPAPPPPEPTPTIGLIPTVEPTLPPVPVTPPGHP